MKKKFILATYETQHFTFELLIPYTSKITTEEVGDELAKQLPKHKRGYPDADIKELQAEIRRGNFSWCLMEVGVLYRDRSKL